MALRPGDEAVFADAPLRVQIDALRRALAGSRLATAVLERSAALDLPGWYLAAGGVAQTVWNQLHGFAPDGGLKDHDIVYFDRNDLSAEGEAAVAARVAEACAGLDVVLDVKNEARVHLWYAQRYGCELEPYASTEHAISTWPTTASSVGVRLEGRDLGSGRFVVCAPFGLRDVFAMVARPNKTIVTREVYEEKVSRWAARWPQLSVVPW
jgi:hypothetical protein